eukprot:942232_1
MSWDCANLRSFTVGDIKIMLRNRGAQSTDFCQCRRKTEFIQLLKQNYDISIFNWSRMEYTAKNETTHNNRKRCLNDTEDQSLGPTTKRRRTNDREKHTSPVPKTDYAEASPRLELERTSSPSPSVDIQVLEVTKSVHCPLTQLKFEHPVKSTLCNHTFEQFAIDEYISSNQNVECPVFGCSHLIAMDCLVKDEEMVKLMNQNISDTSNVLDWTQLSDDDVEIMDEEYVVKVAQSIVLPLQSLVDDNPNCTSREAKRIVGIDKLPKKIRKQVWKKAWEMIND